MRQKLPSFQLDEETNKRSDQRVFSSCLLPPAVISQRQGDSLCSFTDAFWVELRSQWRLHRHRGSMWLRRESGSTGNRKIASSIPGSSRCVEVSLSKTPNPNCSWRAGCLPAWLTPPSVRLCVNVCMNGWRLGDIVKRFEWSLVGKALHKRSPFTMYHLHYVRQ